MLNEAPRPEAAVSGRPLAATKRITDRPEQTTCIQPRTAPAATGRSSPRSRLNTSLGSGTHLFHAAAPRLSAKAPATLASQARGGSASTAGSWTPASTGRLKKALEHLPGGGRLGQVRASIAATFLRRHLRRGAAPGPVVVTATTRVQTTGGNASPAAGVHNSRSASACRATTSSW